MFLATLLVALLGLLSTTVEGAPLQSPLRLRFNSDLLRGVFHKKD
jgi:hypothetical protein